MAALRICLLSFFPLGPSFLAFSNLLAWVGCPHVTLFPPSISMQLPRRGRSRCIVMVPIVIQRRVDGSDGVFSTRSFCALGPTCCNYIRGYFGVILFTYHIPTRVPTSLTHGTIALNSPKASISASNIPSYVLTSNRQTSWP